jgi:hypothetical protein
MHRVSPTLAALLLGIAWVGGCEGGSGGRTNAWQPGADESAGTGVDVDPHDSTSGGGSDDGESKGETGACSPGESGECLCDDGLHLGTQTCHDDGSGWGPCVCDEDPGGSTGEEGGDEGESGGEETGGSPTEVCYPGADMAYTTCFEVTYPDSPPSGYDYPAALGGDANYREPIGYLDLEAIAPEIMVAPNFQLGELAQLSKGRWAVVQVHAVERLQDLRDAVGAITVNSGYRSVAYNAGVDGATHSRHMYGDGFDLDPASGSLTTLENECTSIGGMLVEYDTHVHCDFRFDPVEEEFFGSAGEAPGLPALRFAATVEHEAGVFTATADGFDEGEPTRRWTAFDADGVVLQRALTPVFVAPPGTARVEVEVGRRVIASIEL